MASRSIKINIIDNIGFISMRVCRCRWFSQPVQETVIQSRRGGVTKIASRWGREKRHT